MRPINANTTGLYDNNNNNNKSHKIHQHKA